jgi:hypothetical protein
MKNILIKLGILPSKQPCNEGNRTIFLSNGEKVIAPPKPEKLRVPYSIIPENSLSFSEYLTCVRLRTLEPSKTLFRKFYL